MTGFLRRVKDALTGARVAEQLAQVNRRLERLEAQGDTLHKIWLRTRHLEPAMQALLRSKYSDTDTLPYPERLTARRFRINSQNQEDGLTLALLQEAGPTNRRFIEIGAGLSVVLSIVADGATTTDTADPGNIVAAIGSTTASGSRRRLSSLERSSAELSPVSLLLLRRRRPL